jgi:hypothetical protein
MYRKYKNSFFALVGTLLQTLRTEFGSSRNNRRNNDTDGRCFVQSWIMTQFV